MRKERTLQLLTAQLLLVEGEERGRKNGSGRLVFRVVVGCRVRKEGQRRSREKPKQRGKGERDARSRYG